MCTRKLCSSVQVLSLHHINLLLFGKRPSYLKPSINFLKHYHLPTFFSQTALYCRALDFIIKDRLTMVVLAQQDQARSNKTLTQWFTPNSISLSIPTSHIRSLLRLKKTVCGGIIWKALSHTGTKELIICAVLLRGATM